MLVDIESILSSLGIDLSNPEAKKGAIEAIDAILASRQPIGDFGGAGGAGGGDGGGDQDIEIDPDLLQPSIKNKPSEAPDDIEINDEEDILKDVKHNDSDAPQEPQMSNKDNTNGPDKGGDEPTDDPGTEPTDKNKIDRGDEPSPDTPERPTEPDPGPDPDFDDKDNDFGGGGGGEVDWDDDSEIDPEPEPDYGEEVTDDPEEDFEDADNSFGGGDGDGGDSGDDFADDEYGDLGQGDATKNDENIANDDEPEIDEDELLDDTLKEPYEDSALKAKHESRRIKKERTLHAAKNALSDAKAKNKAPALIRELEKAIEALESLQEATSKSLKDMSDEEFNLMVNRVFDAIDALGDSGLTYSSDEERKIKAQEIKADLENRQTQAELSAEDVARIRAETQVVKAREKENAKYSMKAAGSFKGFQDFLNSLYRAIALQVHTEETRDDSWSAISRRNSGAGVLQQGKKFNELPNKKIPIIDFYFDQSGSWDEDDIKIGEKAVAALAEMEEKGQIKVNIYYFANNVHQDAASARAEGGTNAWNEIVKNVIATQATNVVIMTDWDMEDRGIRNGALSYTVPGYVWYLWKNGYNAPRLPRDLKGRGGTQQFSFSMGDL